MHTKFKSFIYVGVTVTYSMIRGERKKKRKVERKKKVRHESTYEE